MGIPPDVQPRHPIDQVDDHFQAVHIGFYTPTQHEAGTDICGAALPFSGCLPQYADFLVARDFQGDFGGDADPHIFQVPVAGQVFERLNHDRRPRMCKGGFSLSAFLKWLFAAGVVLLLKNRNISAFGDVDADGIVLSGHQVIAFEGPPKLVGLNAHDGVGGLVEILAPAEHLCGHGVALYLVGPSGQRGFHNEFKKGFLDIGSLELGTGQNAVDLLLDRFSSRDGY